ncbi:MAG: NADH-quinone oxidoreductase subunit J [Dehalococcoidia bacterium]
MTGAFETPIAADIVFWLVSVLTVGAALLVVTLRDVFKAAVSLAVSFVGVAGLFFLLQAEFIGIVQILVYVGGVSILIAFAVMLIRDMAGGSLPVRKSQGVAAATVATLFFAAIVFTSYSADWNRIDQIDDPAAVAGLVGAYTEREVMVNGETVRVVEPADPSDPAAQPGVLIDSTGVVGTLLIREYLLPFQIIGLVLVASLIGGLMLMRTRSEEA